LDHRALHHFREPTKYRPFVMHTYEVLFRENQFYSRCSVWNPGVVWCDIVGKLAKYTYCNHTECWESFCEKKYYDQNLSSFLLKLVLLSRFQFLLHIQ